MTQFEAAIASAMRLRNSIFAELLMIAIIYIVGIFIVWRQYVAISSESWYAWPTLTGLKLSPAGIWYVYVGLPLFQFLFFRWYFRIFIWTRFLWQVSRFRLNLLPTHPDRVGGLGFLSDTAYAFAPIAAAHGVVLCGVIASRIFTSGARLPDFTLEIAMVVVFVQCLVLGPLILFGRQLDRVRRTGIREYGALAAGYVGAFDTKWLRGGAPSDEPLLGSGDIQSLADLGNSFKVVEEMHLVPATRTGMLLLAVATLAPCAPLVFTMMPPEQILNNLAGMLF